MFRLKTFLAMKQLSLFLFVSITLLQQLQAAIVSGANVLLKDTSPDFDYELLVYQDQEGTDTTSFLFNVSGSQIIPLDLSIDESSDWYLVSHLDHFYKESIASDSFPLIAKVGTESDPPVFNVFDPGFSDFYLGFNTGVDNLIEGDMSRSVFGWVHLRNDPGVITMLDSAINYNNTGLIIGTTTPVPEPATMSLILSAALALLLRRNRATR